MLLLAIETSCDETSAAIVRDGVVLSNVVASQVRLHAEYGGVVPELATREHLRNLPCVARAALDEAGTGVEFLEGIAATLGPGLPQALMTGSRFAAGVAMARGLPFIGVHHHEAHLYSPWIAGSPSRAEFDAFQPNVSLIASGGHTLLVHVRAELEHEVLGATLDDAAGECFDKVAKLAGLPYPGGPVLDRLAAEGDAKAHEFPRPLLREPGDDFSFSGLKTSVRYLLERSPGLIASESGLRDLCASVQAAIVDVLVGKLVQAARRIGVKWVTASGGVTCNRGFRARIQTRAAAEGLGVRLAEPGYCTDNAAMVGILAERRFARGETMGYDEEIRPGWKL
ncbi:MAG: tRNA (adenosine(37)-N6)-threonylcarbamoyltransferase complex transferase subunit TsaD [Limisphaerales bacterium]